MTVAAVIIGTEVLTAKVLDENGPLLARRLRAQGVSLRWMCTVLDELDDIVEAVEAARRRADWVITSGGIGPTHDDVTIRAVARALARPVVRSPELEAHVRRAWAPDAPPPAAFRLADVPEATELLPVAGTHFPVLVCDRVCMLPGIPAYFRRQLEVLLPRLPRSPVALGCLFLDLGEPEIALVLDRVAAEHADVSIGSYPSVESSAPYRVKLTVEHADARAVVSVVEQLERELPAGAVLRTELPAALPSAPP